MKESSGQREEQFSFFQSLDLFGITSLQFGPVRNTISYSGRILQAFWSLFTIVFIATYTANLAAILSQKTYHKPLKSIDEIAESNYTLFAFSQLGFYLKQSKNPIVAHMIENGRIDLNTSLINTRDKKEMTGHVESAVGSGYIFVGFDAIIDELISKIPNLYKLEGYFSHQAASLAMRKDWEWSQKVHQLFLSYGKSGFFDRVRRNNLDRGKDLSERNFIEPFHLGNFYGVILITFVGGVLSTALMIGAYFWQIYQQKKRVIPCARKY